VLDKGKPLERVGRKTTGLSSSLQSRDMTAGLPGTAVPPLDGCCDHLTIRGVTTMFLTGFFNSFSRFFSITALICITTIITACSNPFGPIDQNEQFLADNPTLQKAAQGRMDEAKRSLKTLDDVRALQKKFKYAAQPAGGWTPTIEVLFARDLTDDCTGAAILGKWSLEQIGIKSRVVTLEGNGEHAVCISEDKSIMISNNSVVDIPPEAWTEAVLTWFTPAFKKISLNLPSRS
jgi:hypothetical protein